MPDSMTRKCDENVDIANDCLFLAPPTLSCPFQKPTIMGQLRASPERREEKSAREHQLAAPSINQAHWKTSGT